MQDIQRQIRQLIERPDEPVTTADVELWMNLCPYLALPVLRYLQQHGDTLDPARRRRLQLLVAMHSPDPARARDVLSGDEADEPFYPEPQRPRKPTTESTIDTFLDKYGRCDEAEEELLTRLIFNPTPDYAQQLAAEEAASLPDEPDDPDDNSQDALINRFIISHPHGESAHHADGRQLPEPDCAPEPEPLADSSGMASQPVGGVAAGRSALSLSLARVYLKQRRFERAKEIITQLSLNNPEKSVYFADQLRFIGKLIRNQELKTSRNQ